ncbi:hypothetical protein HanIR_Chr16g0839151 [Helianthus annuus]|nr:hypothetical protein HanIR_Chr16g0839151 [Helianthus annuus]
MCTIATDRTSFTVVIGALFAVGGLLCFRFHRKRLQIGSSTSRRERLSPFVQMVLILAPSYPIRQWVLNRQERLYKMASLCGLVVLRWVMWSLLLEFSSILTSIDLQKATYNFTSLIGQGALSSVYKA